MSLTKSQALGACVRFMGQWGPEDEDGADAEREINAKDKDHYRFLKEWDVPY